MSVVDRLYVCSYYLGVYPFFIGGQVFRKLLISPLTVSGTGIYPKCMIDCLHELNTICCLQLCMELLLPATCGCFEADR